MNNTVNSIVVVVCCAMIRIGVKTLKKACWFVEDYSSRVFLIILMALVRVGLVILTESVICFLVGFLRPFKE